MKNWIFSIVGIVIGLALVAAYAFSKNKMLAKIAADVIEKSHRGEIETLTRKLQRMDHDFDKETSEIRTAQAELDGKKATLKSMYSMVDLSQDEIVDRLRKLNIE